MQAMARLCIFFTAAMTVLLMPVPASAHLVTTGMGPLYDGIGHLLLTPEDLVPALAVSVFAGLRGKTAGRLVLFLFPCAWLIGGLAGLLTGVTPPGQPQIISFVLFGVLIAADQRLPDTLIILLVIPIGVMHGFYNGAAMMNGPGTAGLLGISTVLFVLLAFVSAFTVSLSRNVARIAMRVAGSWVAAVGLLMIGWNINGK